MALNRKLFSKRLERLALPERAQLLGGPLGEAERKLSRKVAQSTDALHLTHADTKRFPPPSWFLTDLAEAVQRGAEAFTPSRGDRQARAVLAPALSAYLGVAVDPDAELALTAGTQGALFAALAALVDLDDRVLLVDPDYLSSERMLRFFGAQVDPVELRMTFDGPILNLDQIERGLSGGARLLVFSHPNNPTGAVYSEQTIRELARLICEFDAIAVVDELYSRLVYDGVGFHHLVSQPGMKHRCVTLLGPSKTESMSGYRIGCVIAPGAIIDAIEDVEDITSIRAPAYAQHALKRWLVEDVEFVRQRVQEYRVLRDMTVSHLARLPFVRVFPPQATGYLFPDVSALGVSDVEVAEALLCQAHVVVNPGVSFGRRGVGSFRMCFAQDERVWPNVLERIVTALRSLEAKS